MLLRRRNLLLLLLVLATVGCRAIATIIMIPVVVLVMVASIFVGSEGLTDQDELRASGIRIDQHLVHFDLASDLTFEGTVETVSTVTSTAGLADGQKASLSFDPRSQELELVHAEVVNPDGSRHVVTEDRVFTRPSAAAENAPGFVSRQTRTVLFPQLGVGSQTRVKWRFKERGSSVLGFNYSWRPAFTLPVEEMRIRIDYHDVPLHFAARGGIELNSPSSGVIEATLRDYAGQTPERAMVSPRDIAPMFVATTVNSWEEIGARFHEAVADKVESTAEIEALAAEIVGDREGIEAARSIHRWVCRNIQYVAVYLGEMSGWVPHTATEVLDYGYGDCKDQYVLTASLLAARGIRAEPVLISFDRSYVPLPLPTPLQFDHCMAYLPDHDVYSNPTDPYRDLGELDIPLSGKLVVVGCPEGRVQETPVGSADQNRYHYEQLVQIGTDGRASGHSKSDFAGRASGRFRRTLALSASTEQAAEDLLQASPAGGHGSLDTTDPADLEQPLHCEGRWTSDVPIAMEPTLRFTTPMGLDLVNASLIGPLISADTRRFPMLVAAIEITRRHVVELPPGYAFTALPKGRQVVNETGRYDSQYRVDEDGRLVIEQLLRIEQDRFQPEQYPALREVLLAASIDFQSILSAELRL